MAAGADYLDCHFDQRVGPALQALDGRARETGHCLITQAGLFPGMPAVLLRALAAGRGSLEEGHVAMAVSYRVTKPEPVEEVIRIVRDPQGNVLRGGTWRRGGWRDAAVFDFGGRFGRRRCYPLEMFEMREVVSLLGLKEAGLYVGGVNWFVDGVVFPLVMVLGGAGHGMLQRPLAALLSWGANTFTRTAPGVVVLAEGDGATIRIEQADANELGAMAVVACVRQWMSGRLRRPGVLLAGLAADPAVLLEDLATFGAAVSPPPAGSPASGPSPSTPPA
jgi:saccharopine dehydrogenase (NAD+, L-lysine-forming)